MKTLQLIDTKTNMPSSEAKQLCIDKAVTNRFKSIAAYAKETHLKIEPADYKNFVQFVEKSIYKQVGFYAHLMYHYMQQSGDWGEPGEQQVNITFCRCLLKIDPKVQLTEDHYKQFQALIKKNITALKLNTLSATAAESQLKTFTFQFLGETYPLFKGPIINGILKFIGSKKFLHSGQYGKQMEFIFGSGTTQQVEGYTVIHVTKELIRTPNNVMSMAAIIGHQNIYIRLESLKTIYTQKWLQIFDYSEFDMLAIHNEPFWNISEGIKQKVLELYNIDTKEQMIENEDTFIHDMSDTILHHELGHGTVQQNIVPYEMGAIGEASKIFGENIYTAILEFLADFSPPQNNIKGPIQNIIHISKTDRTRAKRMYFMYMSDAWFYNTGDTYMYTYSDLMTLILMRYITKDDILFEQLEKEIHYFDRAKDTSGSTSYFNRILDLYLADITEIKAIAENAEFNVGDNNMDYKKIREFLLSEFQKNDGFVHEDTYEFLVPFWTNVLGYVQKISNSNDILTSYIKQQQEKTLKKLLILSCGKETAMAYKYDHRKYIQERMTELDILAINTAD
jgi:hypothetical protein